MANAIFHSPQQSNPTFTAEVKTTRHEKLSGRDLPEQHPISAITGLESALNGKQAVIEDLDEIRDGASKGETALQPGDVPTVNDGTLTIQKNGTSVGTFSANSSENKTINLTVPTNATEVGALPESTKYGSSLSLSINSSTYVVTAQLKDQNGNNLGSAQTIDLPLESVVVNGSYDDTTKKIILTLQNGNTVEFSVADLVAGLQSEITPDNKLSADLVDDSTSTNKFVSESDKTAWNAKVSDTTVDGISVVNNGVAVIPNASGSTKGVVSLTNSLVSTSNTTALAGSTINIYSENVLGVQRFSSSSTYDVGDRVRNGQYYFICNTAITTPHAWDASEWTQTTILDEVDSKVSDVKVNGTSVVANGVANISLLPYATSTTAAATVQKEVSIPSITSLNAGQLIIVTPTATSTVANSTLKLNNFDAYPMLYGGSAITTSTDSYVWIKDVPGWWLFDGSNWLFAGHGTDINTTYSTMTVANIIKGTETSGRLMRSDYLKDGICGVVTAYASGDTITPADKYLYTSTADISALTVNAPTSPDERYVSQINFSSGTTATTLSYPNTFKVIDGCDDVQTIGGVKVFVPVASKRYQMFILNDGVNNLLVAKGV